jgi:hypothetical protein
MLMRIWCLYVSKLGLLAFVLLALSMFAGWPVVRRVSTTVIVPLAIAGALMAIVYILFRRPIACPNCGGPSSLVGDNKRCGVACERCGLVTARPFLDFSFRVEPVEDDAEEDDDVEL